MCPCRFSVIGYDKRLQAGRAIQGKNILKIILSGHTKELDSFLKRPIPWRPNSIHNMKTQDSIGRSERLMSK